MLKVAKFGGSSMADAAQIRKVCDIVRADEARRIIVVSAAGKRNSKDHKITDLLYLCHAHIKYGVSCKEIFDQIRQRYIDIRDELSLSTPLEAEFDALWEKMQNGIDEDELVSRGEYFSARILADALGYDFIDAKLWLTFAIDGSIDEEASYAALKRIATDRRAVIPGFYGVAPGGRILTLSRGGSDITGALAAAALDADVYENWTDVSGILMADPRIVDNPEHIDKLTYSELRELSYVGAQVLHEHAVFPIKEKNIPLNIRNTNEPDHPGTMIMRTIDDSQDNGHRFITGIAGRKGYTVITLSKTGMSSTPGVLRQILEVFEKANINIEYIPSGIDSLSFVVSGASVENCLYTLLGELEKSIKPDNIKTETGIAVVAAVGRRMAFRPGISGKIFAALGENGVNIRMITQGPEELNIIVGVDEKDFEQAIRALYNGFATIS